jgi:hypothetical protein
VDLLDSAPALPTGPQQQQDQQCISEMDLTIGKVETMSSDLTTQACVDAALRMFDQVQSQPRTTTAPTAQ